MDIAGITVHPKEQWMQQIARNATMEGCGPLRDCRFLLHVEHKVHHLLPSDHRVRSGQTARAACPQSELERLRGALGEIGQGRVFVQGGSLW